MATAVAMTVVRFAATEVAVEVTTDCMPPMSLVIRDCTSPVRVRVKKPSDRRCRWANTSVRSRCITCWPTRVEIQVCTTPNAAVTAATRDHAGGEPDEQPEVALGQRVVDHGAQQER